MENEVVASDLQFFADHAPFLEQLRGKCILITGSTGLIGSTFIKCMIALNKKKGAAIRIVALARNPQKAACLFCC